MNWSVLLKGLNWLAILRLLLILVDKVVGYARDAKQMAAGEAIAIVALKRLMDEKLVAVRAARDTPDDGLPGDPHDRANRR